MLLSFVFPFVEYHLLLTYPGEEKPLRASITMGLGLWVGIELIFACSQLDKLAFLFPFNFFILIHPNTSMRACVVICLVRVVFFWKAGTSHFCPLYNNSSDVVDGDLSCASVLSSMRWREGVVMCWYEGDGRKSIMVFFP